jgi:hypothetical protein
MKTSASIPIIGIALLGMLTVKTCTQSNSLENPKVTSKENLLDTKKDSLENLWQNTGSQRINSSLEDYKGGKYHYNVTISDAHIEGRHKRHCHHNRYDETLINGTYIWDMDIYLPDYQAMFDYILDHLQEMQKYKRISRNNTQYSKDLEYFDDHFDDYYDDPEDGITYPDDVFDYLLD